MHCRKHIVKVTHLVGPGLNAIRPNKDGNSKRKPKMEWPVFLVNDVFISILTERGDFYFRIPTNLLRNETLSL